MRTQLGDDEELIEDVIALYLDDYPHRLRALKAALGRRDLADVRAIAHTIKGGAGSLCATGVVLAARQLELSAAGSDLDAIALDVARLEAALEELAAALRLLGPSGVAKES